jgi:hypothetical protein
VGGRRARVAPRVRQKSPQGSPPHFGHCLLDAANVLSYLDASVPVL